MHKMWYNNAISCIYLHFYLHKQKVLHTFANESEYIYSYEGKKQ